MRLRHLFIVLAIFVMVIAVGLSACSSGNKRPEWKPGPTGPGELGGMWVYSLPEGPAVTAIIEGDFFRFIRSQDGMLYGRGHYRQVAATRYSFDFKNTFGMVTNTAAVTVNADKTRFSILGGFISSLYAGTLEFLWIAAI